MTDRRDADPGTGMNSSHGSVAQQVTERGRKLKVLYDAGAAFLTRRRLGLVNKAGSEWSSVLCPANACRYFAAVAGGPDFILKLVADKEVGGVNPKIPEMKENIRPASARPDKPETTAVAGLQSTNRHELLARLGKRRLFGRADPSIGKIGYRSKSTVM